MEKQLIEDLLVTAFEGGSNYWYLADINNSLDNVYSYIIEGGSIKIYDVEDPDTLLGSLDYQACKEALVQMKKEYVTEYANCISETYDALDADIFLQLAVMQDVIYG